MAARNLLMPGARERIGGGAGAVAEGVIQNGIGVSLQPAGENIYENRAASPIMQPLPLASRYGGGNHDSLRPASAALRSTWIQRLRPSSPDVSCREFGHEVAKVWRDPQPALWRSNTPLLLAGPSKEPLHHPVPRVEPQQHQAYDGSDMRLMVTEQACASKVPARNIDCMDKGKGRSLVEGQTALEATLTAGERRNDIRPVQAQQVKPPVFAGCMEGSSKRQGVDSPHEGNNGMAMHSSQNPQSNGVSGALVTGFGPLRVLLKAPVGNILNKSLGSSSKLKGLLIEGLQAADAASSGSQFISGPDRNRVASSAGPQVMMTWTPGNSDQPTMRSSPDANMEIDHGSHIVRSRELFGEGFYPVQRAGYESDNCGPFVVHRSQARGKDKMFGYAGCWNGNRSADGLITAGEDHPMSHSMKGWYKAFPEIGVDRASKGMAATHSFGPVMAGEGRIDCGQQLEGKHHSLTNLEMSGKHVYVANGLEAMDKCYADVGCSQRQASHLSPPFSPYQPASHISSGKQPLPFSPARSPSHIFEEKGPTGDEDGNSSQERPQQTPLLTPLMGPKQPLQDGMEGTSMNPPWSSLFAAYKVLNQPGEPPNSNSSTGTLPLDGRVRVNEGQNPGNGMSSVPKASGNQDVESGGSAKTGVHLAVSSAEDRSLFDNQSSKFSSSPWPVDDGYNPAEDAGSAFHSQASHTPSSQVPSTVQAPTTLSNGQENSIYRYYVGRSILGGSKDVSHKRARSREHSGSLSRVLRNFPEGMEDSRKARSGDDENNAHEPVKNPRQPPVPSSSLQKDDTSGSSAPSLPMGCNNSSDLRSPAFPGVGFEDRGRSRAVPSRTANLDSETDVLRLGRQLGMVSTPGGLFARWREPNEPQRQTKVGVRRDLRECGARLCKDLETQEAQPMVGDAFREVCSRMTRPIETADLVQKQSRLRNSSDVVSEAGPSGPSKRSRHHPHQTSWDFQIGGSGVQPREPENGAGADKPSSWLARWLPVGSKDFGGGMNSPTAARPGDEHWSSFGPGYPISGRTSGAGDGRVHGSRAGGHVRRADGNGLDRLNNTKDSSSSKRAIFGLPPFSTPSAAAMALVGTAARKLGPLPSQRKGPIAMWPSVHLETTQTPEPQTSVRSSELPT